MGEFQAPKKKIECRPAGVELPENKNRNRSENWAGPEVNAENEQAIDDQVGHDEKLRQSEAIARGYPRILNSGLPLARAAENDSTHQPAH